MGIRELAPTPGATAPVGRQFQTLNESIRQALADITSPLILSLAALSLAKDRFGIEELSADDISRGLIAAGVDVSSESVRKALGRPRGLVSARLAKDGSRLFSVMTAGERKIPPQLHAGTLQVLRFDGSAPRSARVQVGEVLGRLKGPICICDPYLGSRTLNILEELPPASPVRFLTGPSSGSLAKIDTALKDFIREYPNVSFRVIDAGALIHDRYVLTDSVLMLLGHGLKDVGSKESFVIVLDQSLVPDLIAETRGAFETRWTGARSLG